MPDDQHLPSTADHVGQAAGGITGVLAGAAIGTAAGPLGVLLGGIAGAIGGWWSGRAIAEAAEDLTDTEGTFFDEKVARDEVARPARLDDARASFFLGEIAAANPEYAEREFSDVEPDLSRGWQTAARGHEDWDSIRRYASMGFERGKERRRRPRD
jgi:hypothetical protein